VIERVAGLRARLEAGARVADVGCGAGAALLVLGQAFPAAELHGYELSRHALARAEDNRVRSGLANVAFHAVPEDALPEDGRFDLVLTFDCLHDMTHPERVARSIRGALHDQGVWLIADIKSHATFAENVAQNPMASLMMLLGTACSAFELVVQPHARALATASAARGARCRAGFGRLERLTSRTR
jgi:2-polyprenyl-3-methyl-5-hydroxy-6-metoxy-1,4-benzoquinol methylase